MTDPVPHPTDVAPVQPPLRPVVTWLVVASVAVTLSLWIRGETSETKAIFAFETDHVMAQIRFMGWSNTHRVDVERWRRGDRAVVPLVVIAPWRAVSVQGRPDSVAATARALGGSTGPGATEATVVVSAREQRSLELPWEALGGLRTLVVSSSPLSLPGIGLSIVHESAVVTPGISALQRDLITWPALVSSVIAFFFVLTQRRRWWLLAAAPPLALTIPALFTSFVITLSWITFAATMAILICGLSLFRPGDALPPVGRPTVGATPHEL